MEVSRRAGSLKPSTTLAVTAKARELKAQGVEVVSFAAGEPDFDTPQRVKDALIEALRRGETKYAPVPGDPATRKVIADKLTRENRLPGVTPDHVVISSGGKQSLALLLQALIDPPSPGGAPAEVLLPTPAWVSYAPMTELAQGRVVEIPTIAGADFKVTPAALERAITPNSRVLILNSPGNPTGTMYDESELRAIAGVVARAAATIAPNLVVVSDELYEKIIYAGIPHFSIGSVPEIAERTVTVNGLSKAYAMTGWRIGYLAGSAGFGLKVAKAVATLQSQSTTSIATFELPAIRAALTECAAEVEAMRREYESRAKITYALLKAIPGIVCPRPTGAFYAFPDISCCFGRQSPAGRRIDSAASFAGTLLEEAHVAVVPGEDFGAGGERCVRVTFACSEDEIRKGLGAMDRFIRALR